jgi:hypothetical protein
MASRSANFDAELSQNCSLLSNSRPSSAGFSDHLVRESAPGSAELGRRF